MANLAKASPEMRSKLDDVMRRFHGPLVDHEVTVGLLVAWPAEGGDGVAVKLHGYPCAAVVKITPYRQRVQGIEDVVITLDGALWAEMSDAERTALLDHELYHLDLARDKDGQVKADDAGRPKLKMRLHDWQLGGFEAIGRRHRDAALEVQAFKEAQKTYSQALFAWGDDMAGDPEAA